MSNWASYQESITDLPVHKRAKHGIHFMRPDGQIQADFVGKPCHYLDGGLWKPIDTKLLLGGDGYYGCPHSKVRISKDGYVKVEGTDYIQRTELPTANEGLIDDDVLVRKFAFGEQRMWVTEGGFRSEITLNRIPTLQEARKLVPTEAGILPKDYIKSLTTATDTNGDIHTFTTLTAFRTWLASAKFPVTIDPDFAVGTSDRYIYSNNADYATARSTSAGEGSVQDYISLGQDLGYVIYRGFLEFDTSGIEDVATVTQANLKLTWNAYTASMTNFDVQIVKQAWTGTREENFDGCLAGTADDSIWQNTSAYSANTQASSGNLSTAWVNKTGTTYYSLRSSRDYAGNAPSGVNERIRVWTANNATESYRPVLTVTYTAGGALLKVNMNGQMQNLSGGMRG